MRKSILLAALMILAGGFAFAQDEEETPDGWYTGGGGSVGITFTGLSNWAAGGVNSVSGLAAGNLFANWKSGRHKWDNSLVLEYGKAKLQDDVFSPRKISDLLSLTSSYGYELGNNWYASALFNLLTQFDLGYEYITDASPVMLPDGSTYTPADDRIINSKFMSPGFVNLGLGAEWKPQDNFSLFISPANARITIVADDELNSRVVDAASNTAMYGVDSGKTTVFGLGANVRAHYHTNLADNILFNTDLNLFYDYLNSPVEGAPIDVDWRAGITAEVLKYLSITLSGHLIYDADVYITDFDNGVGDFDGDGNPTVTYPTKQAGTQLKGVVSIGVGYTFDSRKKSEG